VTVVSKLDDRAEIAEENSADAVEPYCYFKSYCIP